MKAAAIGLVASVLGAQPDGMPNIPDLTITTRTSTGIQSTETIYFKAARQRHESITEIRSENHKFTTLIDCQDRRRTMLNDAARTYAAVPIENLRERIARVRRTGQAIPVPEATGPEVTITIDSVDTGERRQLGRYTARHVVTTMTTEAAPGATAKSGTWKRDAWYLDLPDSTCSTSDGWPIARLSGYTVRAGQPPPPRDREHIQYLHRARLGFPIEQVDGSTKIELADFSEAPLDDALFAIPADYRPALRTPYGGFDMTKPDTLLNRVELYCGLWTMWVRNLFR